MPIIKLLSPLKPKPATATKDQDDNDCLCEHACNKDCGDLLATLSLSKKGNLWRRVEGMTLTIIYLDKHANFTGYGWMLHDGKSPEFGEKVYDSEGGAVCDFYDVAIGRGYDLQTTNASKN